MRRLVLSFRIKPEAKPQYVDFITSGHMDADYSLIPSYYKGIRKKSQRIKEKIPINSERAYRNSVSVPRGNMPIPDWLAADSHAFCEAR